MDDDLTQRVLIHELNAKYNEASDADDGERLAELFTPDGELTVDSGAQQRHYKGTEEFRVIFASGGGPVVTVHASTDSIIQLDGDRATQRSTMLQFRRLEGSDVLSLRIGRYVDELRRTPDGWRYQSRNATFAETTQGAFAA
jgi:hypothetical protein